LPEDEMHKQISGTMPLITNKPTTKGKVRCTRRGRARGRWRKSGK